MRFRRWLRQRWELFWCYMAFGFKVDETDEESYEILEEVKERHRGENASD